jgi:SAM-dependent methyltransferase
MRGRDNTLHSGERQVAPTLAGIRRDHVARYEWAAKHLQHCATVLDIGCGIGYGTHVLAESGCYAIGCDVSEESIGFAREHYAHPNCTFVVYDVAEPIEGNANAAVCFEVIEHLRHPAKLLSNLNVPTLLASVPNQSVYPYEGQRFHVRHYTQEQFEDLLNLSGWRVVGWYGQRDTEGDVEPELDTAWTLIARCERDEGS